MKTEERVQLRTKGVETRGRNRAIPGGREGNEIPSSALIASP